MAKNGSLETRSVSAPCAKCSSPEPFDAEVAYKRLVRKHTELANTVSEYMSQAGFERGLRTANALALAERLDRIVGGHTVTSDEYPDCCLVGRQNANGTFGWFCSGVLVHPRIVLTAGHCLVSGHVANSVALRAKDQTDLTEAEIIPIQTMVAHPLYVQSHQFHDISVIVLRKEAKEVKPVEIAAASELDMAEKTTLVGFGNNDKLSTRGFGLKRKVTVPTTEIRRSPGAKLGSVEHTLGFDGTCEFVAGGDGYDSCNGDSGGPAYIDVNGSIKVAGLTSRSVEGATDPCGDGGIYSRIDENLTFVRETAAAADVSI